MNDRYINVTTHKFKTHFSHYVRLLHDNPEKSVVVYQYNKPVGIFVPLIRNGESENDKNDETM